MATKEENKILNSINRFRKDPTSIKDTLDNFIIGSIRLSGSVDFANKYSDLDKNIKILKPMKELTLNEDLNDACRDYLKKSIKAKKEFEYKEGAEVKKTFPNLSLNNNCALILDDDMDISVPGSSVIKLSTNTDDEKKIGYKYLSSENTTHVGIAVEKVNLINHVALLFSGERKGENLSKSLTLNSSGALRSKSVLSKKNEESPKKNITGIKKEDPEVRKSVPMTGSLLKNSKSGQLRTTSQKSPKKNVSLEIPGEKKDTVKKTTSSLSKQKALSPKKNLSPSKLADKNEEEDAKQSKKLRTKKTTKGNYEQYGPNNKLIPGYDLTELRKAFELLDIEDEEKINKKDILEALKEEGKDVSNPVFYNMLSELKSKDDYVTWPEFAKQCHHKMSETDKKEGLERIFNIFLPQKDYTSIDYAELRDIKDYLKLNYSDEYIQNLLSTTTTSQHGIDYNDFEELFTKKQNEGDEILTEVIADEEAADPNKKEENKNKSAAQEIETANTLQVLEEKIESNEKLENNENANIDTIGLHGSMNLSNEQEKNQNEKNSGLNGKITLEAQNESEQKIESSGLNASETVSEEQLKSQALRSKRKIADGEEADAMSDNAEDKVNMRTSITELKPNVSEQKDADAMSDNAEDKVNMRTSITELKPNASEQKEEEPIISEKKVEEIITSEKKEGEPITEDINNKINVKTSNNEFNPVFSQIKDVDEISDDVNDKVNMRSSITELKPNVSEQKEEVEKTEDINDEINDKVDVRTSLTKLKPNFSEANEENEEDVAVVKTLRATKNKSANQEDEEDQQIYDKTVLKIAKHFKKKI